MAEDAVEPIGGATTLESCFSGLKRMLPTRYGACLCILLAAAGSHAAVSELGSSLVPVGVNLEGVKDWARMSMFSDLMKSSRPWGTAAEPWVHQVRTDSLGWPMEDAGVVVRTVQDDAGDPKAGNRSMQRGLYRLSFHGRATVLPVASPGVTVQNTWYDAATDTSTADVVVGEGVRQLILSFRKTQAGVRDVRLLPVATEPGQTFSAEFRAAVAPFGTLRLMEFLETNGNPVRQWSERTTRASSTQGGPKGAAYEYAVQLANELQKDIWINIPFFADDEYIRSLAQLLKGSLAPGRVVYLEYSNELWNHQFSQTKRNIEAAVSEALGGDTTLTNDTHCTDAQFKAVAGDCNPYWAGLFRVGKRTVRIAQIFSEVFGRGALNRTVRVVYATQFANRFIAEQVLKNIATYRGKPAAFLYAVAAAPYFYLDDALSRSPGLQADAIHASLQRSLDRDVLPFLAPGVTQGTRFVKGRPYAGGAWDAPSLKALADYYGIESIAYEGGPDFRQADVALAAKFAASSDARAGREMEQFLAQWYGCGNGLYVHYTLTSGYGRYGYWGLTNEPHDLDAPKYRALAQAARRRVADYRTCR